MWRNYLTVGIRSLAKNKTYAFINIAGLALGLAACLMIMLYVRYETSYDEWLPDSERIYQVQATWHEVGQPVSANQTSPYPVADTIAGGFPQIEAVARAMPGELNTVRDGQPVVVEALIVDPAFFDIFKLDFVHGSAQQALPNVTSVVLTETEAMKQFGSTDALGRTITERSAEGEQTDYTVTGVIRDLPDNSHMQLATIFRFDPAMFADWPADSLSWGNMSQYHYVKLRPGADAAAINAAFPAWEKRVIPPQIVNGKTGTRADIMDLELVNIADVHLGEAQLGAMTPGSDPRTVATFSIVAALILAMAAINFINLSTARAGQRAREVALRKVLGANRRQLIVQFLGESVLLAGIAMLIALAAVELVTPLLASYLDVTLRFDYLGTEGYLLPALGLTLLVGGIGGLYPAFYLSRFQPAKVLRANKSSGDAAGSGRLRTILVVTQFAISIGLIVCTWVVWSQTRYVQTVDPGFEREGLIQVSDAWRLSDNYDAFKREVQAVPGVVAAARTGLGVAATNKSIQSVQAPGAPADLNIGVYRVDKDFFDTMAMRLLAGRQLGDRFANDLIPPPAEGTAAATAPAREINVVVNRRAASLLGFAAPAAAAGQPIRVGLSGSDPTPATIAGVVEDTRIRTARDEIEPLIFVYQPSETHLLMVRYRSATPASVMADLQRVWARFLPDLPFEADFAEDLVAEQYARERARGTIFAAFSILAVIISCLGLFGLAAFTTERRTKEIGIRKVLGARVRDIVRLLAWQFSKPVILGNLVAWPVAWWAMRDWLNTFDARIALTPTPFAVAGILALGIAIGTVAGHALKVARLNPIHALRYE